MTKLTNKEAIEILTYANEWRRCCDEPSTRTMKMPDPKQFGLAIDHAIEVLKCFEGAEVNSSEIETFNFEDFDLRMYAIPKPKGNNKNGTEN